MLYTLAMPIQELNINHIIFKEHTINKLLANSTFCKLMYSNTNCHISGIPFHITLHEHVTNTKYKFVIHKEKNKQLIQTIKKLEEAILLFYKHSLNNKKPVLKLTNHLLKGTLKINHETATSNLFIIKIIGIWESQLEYGITYRITNHL